VIQSEYEKEARQIFMQHVFDKQVKVNSDGTVLELTDDQVIPYADRVKTRDVPRDDEAIARIIERVEQCRLYLASR
jgi:hypothetical protein